MNCLRPGVTALLFLTGSMGAGHAATVWTSAYFSAESSNEEGGFTCIDFSVSGSHVSCDGTRYYYDSDLETYVGYSYEAEASGTAGALRTRTSLSNTPAVDLDYDESAGYSVAETGEPLDERFDDNYVEFDWDEGIVGEYVNEHVFTEENDRYAVSSSASLRDTITVFSSAQGSTGQIRLSYELDGTNTSQSFMVPNGNGGSRSFHASSYASLSIYESGLIELPDGSPAIGRVTQGTTINTSFNESRNEVVDLYLDITFNEAFDLNISLFSDSSIINFGIDSLLPLFETSSEFFSTATLTGLTVLDDLGQEVDFFLQSASDDSVFESFSTLAAPPAGNVPSQVPLPASAVLLGFALGALGIASRSRRRA